MSFPSEANTGVRDSQSHDVVNYYDKQEGDSVSPCSTPAVISNGSLCPSEVITVALVHEYMDMMALTIFLGMP